MRDVLGKYGFVSNYEQLDFDDDLELVYFDCTPPYPDIDLQGYLTRSFPLLRKNLKGVGEIIL